MRLSLNSRIASRSWIDDMPRCFSSAAIAKSFVPKPTWSIKDLKLTDQTDPVSQEELQILAKRSLLDVQAIGDDTQLRQDLANMLHCLNQIQSVPLKVMTAAEIYDVPRGVSKAPLRTRESTASETAEANHVFKAFLQPKTIKQGSYDYFAVITKIDEV